MKKFHVEIFRAIIFVAFMTLILSALLVMGTLMEAQ